MSRVEMARDGRVTPYSIAVKIFTGSVIWPDPRRKIDTGTLIERQRIEREERAGRHSRADERQRDREKNAHGPLAPRTRAGVLELRIDALEARRHRPHHVRHGDHHVREGQPDEGCRSVHHRVD